jgi:hypothetical protein
MNFLKSFGAWSVFTCLTPLVAHLRGGSPLFRISDLLILLPFLLISAVGCALLWLPMIRRYTEGEGWVAGIFLGLLLTMLTGFVLLRNVSGIRERACNFSWYFSNAPAERQGLS